MNSKILSVLLTLCLAIVVESKTYEGYKLYNIVPKTKEEVKVLEDIQKSGYGEFWYDFFYVDQNAKIMVSPAHQNAFLDHMNATNIEFTETIEDLQTLIDNQLKSSQERSSRSSESFHSFTWDKYHTLDEIYAWLDELELNYPDIVTTVIMGSSVENREIKGIVINYNPERTKPIGVLEGTLHAREWISPATVTWIVKEFLTSTDSRVRAMAENIEWHIFPVVNPDGYVYTFTTNRMWRKNRSTDNFVSCAVSGVDDDMSNGIDLNRNFDLAWMSVGASDNPCLNTYAGPMAFSEPEGRAIANYVLLLKEKGDIIYYIAFHSYSQLFVIPYSHVQSEEVLLANNYGDMYEIAIRAAEALERRYGTVYTVGISADVLYPMSGTSFDWAKYAADIPVAYLIELRDLGEYGFLLPAEQIIPNNLEIMDAMIEMDRTTRNLGYYGSGSSSIVSSIFIITFGVAAVIYL